MCIKSTLNFQIVYFSWRNLNTRDGRDNTPAFHLHSCNLKPVNLCSPHNVCVVWVAYAEGEDKIKYTKKINCWKPIYPLMIRRRWRVQVLLYTPHYSAEISANMKINILNTESRLNKIVVTKINHTPFILFSARHQCLKFFPFADFRNDYLFYIFHRSFLISLGHPFYIYWRSFLSLLEISLYLLEVIFVSLIKMLSIYLGDLFYIS